MAEVSESLLAHYTGQPLIDPYAIYQHLMDYWASVMQDDAYLIAADGWTAVPVCVVEKDKKGKEKYKGWVCDLLPKALLVAHCFAKEQARIDDLSARLDAASGRLAELEEEHGGDDAAFAGFDKTNTASVKDCIREIGSDLSAADELVVHQAWLQLAAEETALKKQIRQDEAELDALALAHYARLTPPDIRALVVDGKWMAALAAAIHGEMDRVSQQLTQRVKELAERYETPLPELTRRASALQSSALQASALQASALQARVAGHLATMGFPE